ncbi:MAG: hypothetical protein ACOX9R_02115 [Armatimonadota bacterium]|jgi:hypothetical protein
MAAVVLIALLAASAACAQGTLPQPVQTAVNDLAQRLNVGHDAITVASFEEVTWPDASLGDPQPGRIYAQVQTPGYRVFLHAEGQRWEYHTDRGTRVALVGSQELVEGGVDALTEEQETRIRLAIIAQAKQHIAERLEIELGEVYLGAVEERTWPSAALGVEEPGEMYAQVMTPGYRLVLEARGVLYDYHTDLTGQIRPAGIVEPGAIPHDAGAQFDRPPAVEAAVVDLAARLSTRAEAIAVVDVERVEWSSGALGLPEPGMMYTQAIVPGYRIVLEAKGRNFAYHADDGASARYAGLAYPQDAAVSILAMSPTEPADGNNFFHLLRIDPVSQQRQTALEFVSEFVTTPDGRDLVIKRRTSRSGHQLAHLGADRLMTELASAFDFHGIALRHDGQMLACWTLPSVADRNPRLSIFEMTEDAGAPIEPQIPGFEPGSFTTGMMTWTNDGLAFTVRGATGARSFYWTPDGGIQELGSFAVMGWVPRTGALLIRRAQNNREVLATFVPGVGETAMLADVPAMQSVSAPEGEQWVVASVSEGAAPQIQQITWGGSVAARYDLQRTQAATVRVSPLGDMIVAEYARGDATRVDLIGLEGGLQAQTISDVVGAVPVAD